MKRGHKIGRDGPHRQKENLCWMFFFSRTHRRVMYHYINRKRVYMNTHYSHITCVPDKYPTTRIIAHYEPAPFSNLVRVARALAPAMHHKLVSSPVKIGAFVMLGATLLNKQSLWCHQSAHAPKMTTEFSPCCVEPPTKVEYRLHQASKWLSVGCGERAASPKHCKVVFQNWCAMMHPVRRWCMISSSWSLKEHLSGCGRCRRISQSAVQHQPWLTCHRKNLYLFGARVFHMHS